MDRAWIGVRRMPRWSKLKAEAETRLADSLQGRVAFYWTAYGLGNSSSATRIWMTLDGVQVFYCSEHEAAVFSNHNFNFLAPLPDGVYRAWDVRYSMQDWFDLSLEKSLASPNPLVRALALLDRRLGKRRLKTLRLPDNASELEQKFLGIRLKAEGIVPIPEVRSA